MTLPFPRVRTPWLPILLALTAGALPAHAQGSFLRAEDARVAAIGYRLAVANPALCAKQGPVSGILLHYLAEYAQADRPGLIAGGMDRGPGVLAVTAGSPGEAAGLRAGDVLLSANGVPFESPAAIAAERDKEIWRARLEAGETRFHAQLAQGPVALSVLRGGQTLARTLTPRTGCPLRIRLTRSGEQKAVADGPYVIVTTALLALARNDDELAFVIGHEMAHIVLGHAELLKAQGVPHGGLMRGFGKNGVRVRATEAAADQLGGELALAAGYDPARGAAILKRLPPELGFGIFQSHDGDGKRIKAMRALVQRHAAPRP